MPNSCSRARNRALCYNFPMKPIFALPLIVLVAGCISVEDSGGGSRFVSSLSPTAKGEAIFTKEIGLQDSAVNFEVIDAKVGAKPITVGLVGDDKWKGKMPHAAVWSKDGTVIAVQGADFKSWSHVYDFKRSDKALCDVYPEAKRAQDIEKLLKSRGGIGPKVLEDWANFDKFARPVAENGR